MNQPLISEEDIEDQEFYHNEIKERHKDELTCMGLMILCMFIHIALQVLEI